MSLLRAGSAGIPGIARGRDFRLLLWASVFIGLGACVNAAAFNNYLRDSYALDVARRTFLEFPRELPGFLVSAFIGILAGLGDVRIAAIANLASALGMAAIGWIPPVYAIMVSAVFLYSVGGHLYMPLANAIGMGFAQDGKEGRVLGRIQASSTAALVTGSAVLLLLFQAAGLSYRTAFSAGAICYFIAGLLLYRMKPARREVRRARFVYRREYRRYYVLSILFGARKQLFITFGPWMIVDLFRQPVSTMTLLFFIVSVLGIFTKPAIGRLTDRFGPGRVLTAESFITIGVCMLYAFAPGLLPAHLAVLVVSACYVIDQASDAVSMSRAVYVKRILVDPADLSPTLSLGISIDHVLSMLIPMLGGLLWLNGGNTGYRWVFLGGAFVAALNAAVTRGITAMSAAAAGNPAPEALRADPTAR